MTCSNITGWRFERILHQEFPEFVDHTRHKNLPDFEHEQFWVEAKTAVDKSDYGIIPKEYQLQEYPHNIEKPLVYFCGYHTLFSPSKRLQQRTLNAKKAYARRNMEIQRIFVISHDIIERIDTKHRIINKKGTISYIGIPANYFLRIMSNDYITQGTSTKRMDEHLGLDLDTFACKIPEKLHSAIPYGWILHKEDDAVVIDFLERMGGKK
ncbi:MAG: hypothetical protein ACMXYK_04555 [Candidatus Woesearchaeota archaeon]